METHEERGFVHLFYCWVLVGVQLTLLILHRGNAAAFRTTSSKETSFPRRTRKNCAQCIWTSEVRRAIGIPVDLFDGCVSVSITGTGLNLSGVINIPNLGPVGALEEAVGSN